MTKSATGVRLAAASAKVVTILLGVAGLQAHVEPATAQGIDSFFVSGVGNDGWSGRLSEPNQVRTDGPFASLARARDALRDRSPRTRPAVVTVRGGLWLLTQPLVLDSKAGGTRSASVVWRSDARETARLAGAVRLSNWQHVHDPVMLARLPARARDSVVVTSLPPEPSLVGWKSSGRGSITPTPPELVWNGKVLTVARWPNAGWDRIISVDSTAGVRVGLATDRMKRWARAADAWVHGYWRWDWFDAYLPIKGVDVQARQIILGGNPTYGIAGGARYVVMNLIEELDLPVE